VVAGQVHAASPGVRTRGASGPIVATAVIRVSGGRSVLTRAIAPRAIASGRLLTVPGPVVPALVTVFRSRVGATVGALSTFCTFCTFSARLFGLGCGHAFARRAASPAATG